MKEIKIVDKAKKVERNIYRFSLYGYVDVTATSLEDAQAKLKTIHGHDKSFTTHEQDIFSFGSFGKHTDTYNDGSLG